MLDQAQVGAGVEGVDLVTGGGKAERVVVVLNAGVGTVIYVSTLAVSATGQSDQLINGPGAVVSHLVDHTCSGRYDLLALLVTVALKALLLSSGVPVGVQQGLVEVEHLHLVQHVGGDIAGDEVHGVCDGNGLDHVIRPPGLLQVDVGAVDGLEVFQVTLDSEHALGTGVGSNDVEVVGLGLVYTLYQCHEGLHVLNVTFLGGELQLHVQTALDLTVTVIKSVLYVVAGDLLDLELGVLGVPVQNTDLVVLVVQRGKIVAFASVLILYLLGIIVHFRAIITGSNDHHKHQAGKKKCKQSGKFLHVCCAFPNREFPPFRDFEHTLVYIIPNTYPFVNHFCQTFSKTQLPIFLGGYDQAIPQKTRS